MVFYFSGTGNSQLVAIKIAEIIKDEVVSINKYLKTGKKGEFQSDRPLVFVAPIYSWRMPRVVEQWILNSDFKGNQDAYFVLTCGGNGGNSAVYAKKFCEKKGFNFRGLSAVIMPENYLAMFSTPSESESKAIIEKAKPHINELAEQIRSGKNFTEMPVSFIEKLESGPVNPLFYTFCVKDRGFKVTNDCISCGKCAKRCSINNIELVGGKPIWKGNCTHCMACIGGCPTKAIDYKSKSRGRNRYYIMDDNLCFGEV